MRPGTERDFVGYGRHIPRARWPNNARLAISLVVNYEEGSEYNIPDGDGRNEGYGEIAYAMRPDVRDLSTESIYEYGSRAGIWRLLRLFAEYDVKATFFACALALERNPAVGEAIQEYGHEPCSHGWRWDEPWEMSVEEERERIHKAVASIEKSCGVRPYGWYTRYGPGIHTRELLVEEGGFLYDSNAYNDDLPYFVRVGEKRHLVLPYTHTYNDGRFVLSPGYSSPWDYFENCRRGIQYLWEEGETHPRMISLGLHPRWIGQAGRTHALRELIEYALNLGNVWFARRIDIARWWLEHHDSFVP
ncbi:MAG TPA: allantoinase [Chloroflexi bacterium]|nr:allantoinase [Chloroflexota bacterium]